MESYESKHSDQSFTSKLAKDLGVTAAPLRLDSQAKYGESFTNTMVLARNMHAMKLEVSQSTTGKAFAHAVCMSTVASLPMQCHVQAMSGPCSIAPITY